MAKLGEFYIYSWAKLEAKIHVWQLKHMNPIQAIDSMKQNTTQIQIHFES